MASTQTIVDGLTSALANMDDAQIQAAYDHVTHLLIQKFPNDAQINGALAGLKQNPQVWAAPLQASLDSLHADEDPDIVASINKLRRMLKEKGHQVSHITQTTGDRGVNQVITGMNGGKVTTITGDVIAGPHPQIAALENDIKTLRQQRGRLQQQKKDAQIDSDAAAGIRQGARGEKIAFHALAILGVLVAAAVAGSVMSILGPMVGVGGLLAYGLWTYSNGSEQADHDAVIEALATKTSDIDQEIAIKEREIAQLHARAKKKG
jgi:hypothetical protein